MRLTVVGCSGSFPGPDSAASCYLVEADLGDGPDKRTWRILLDLGNGALGSCTTTSTRSPSTPCCSATCTPTTAWTCAATT